MKEFLATWIIFQLVILGMVGGSIAAEVKSGTYDCEAQEEVVITTFEGSLVGALIPLSLFIPKSFTRDYCNSNNITMLK